MRRLCLFFCSTLFLLLVGHPAHAGWYEFWQRVHLDWHRNNVWPEPFQHADRMAARAPWEVMKNNGWRLQNTISNELFTENNELTHAGELKTRWVVTQAPVHRRTVFVLQARTADGTEKRLDEVQRAVARILPDGPLPQVLLTEKVPRSGAGDYFDQIDRKARAAIPVPTLPEQENNSGEGG